jgi:hypothetical protein
LSEGLLAVVVKHAGAQQISEHGVPLDIGDIKFGRIRRRQDRSGDEKQVRPGGLGFLEVMEKLVKSVGDHLNELKAAGC